MSKEKETTKKGKVSLLLIVIILLVVVIVAGGAFAGFMILGQKTTTNSTSTSSGKSTPSYYYDLTEFLVNLSDTNEKRYLKATISLGYNSKKMDSELKLKEAVMRDVINSVLRNKKASDFSTVGTESLKNEIKDRINPYLTTGKISDIYFKDIIVQ